MFVVLVYAQVIPEFIDNFKTLTLENARNSIQEAGIARFDFIQQQDDPTRFVLIEVYRDQEAPARHRETAHYQRWRDAVSDMMAEPRTAVRYDPLFPEEKGWG